MLSSTSWFHLLLVKQLLKSLEKSEDFNIFSYKANYQHVTQTTKAVHKKNSII